VTDTITKLIAIATEARAIELIAAANFHVSENLCGEVAAALKFEYFSAHYDEWVDATLAPGVVLRFFITGVGPRLILAHTCRACDREERYDVRDLGDLARILAEVTGPRTA